IPLALVQVVASELLQARLIPYRAGDVHDAIADVVGIALGVWLDAGAKLTARADGSPRQRRAG
ncbi:MAG: hypothetical protein Q4F67_00675, partial [Propionibacteriaceae bacterium]|nr:hypothetical protein [Propionibacteriaceae bacterium]